MAKADISNGARKFINKLKANEPFTGVLRVIQKQLLTTRDGHPYLSLRLSDKTGEINGKIWKEHNPEQLSGLFEKDDFVLIEGRVDTYNEENQLIINRLSRVEPSQVDLADFIRETPQDIELLFVRLKEAIAEVKDPYLARLLARFMEDETFVQAFKSTPASIKHHQAYSGGLLEHTVTLLSLAQGVIPSYPKLDRDLLLTGIILHDMGKIKEYRCPLSPEHTDEGRLVGHTTLGVLMLEEKVRQIPDFPEGLLMKLRHLLVSHHGERAYGAPVVPMTAEALILHYLDNLDARVAEYYHETEKLNAGEVWTKYSETLARRFYRGGSPNHQDTK